MTNGRAVFCGVVLGVLAWLAGCGAGRDRTLTPLAAAARTGEVAAIKGLLAGGADPAQGSGVNGWTPLVHAVHKHQAAAVDALLAAGPRARTQLREALRMAAGYGEAGMVRALLAAGADAAADGPELLALAAGGAWDNDYDWPGCAAQEATTRALVEAAPGARIALDLPTRYALWRTRRHGCDGVLALVGRR